MTATCRSSQNDPHIQTPTYRPPSEAKSLLLQATIGCSWNRCTFCGMYRGIRFRIRKIHDLRREIAWARVTQGDVRRVFLADGDALMAPPRFLHQVLAALRGVFPDLERVACYASPQALQTRSVEEMAALREAGLGHYYLGVESGLTAVLERLDKGVDAEEMVRVAKKATAAGVGLSTMILLGSAGRALSLEHARASARALNCIQPRFASTLVTTPVPGTPLYQASLRGEFEQLTATEITRELREFLTHIELDDTVFRANHATNHLVLAGDLPRDKATLLAHLDRALSDPAHAPFVPARRRAI